ncbi:hypothetical protein HGA88_00350 [Candidatus Roizmanbacteria bacterium]|nr:hypothetical protein [Candidatus Roizmanbacteria bacterium]
MGIDEGNENLPRTQSAEKPLALPSRVEQIARKEFNLEEETKRTLQELGIDLGESDDPIKQKEIKKTLEFIGRHMFDRGSTQKLPALDGKQYDFVPGHEEVYMGELPGLPIFASGMEKLLVENGYEAVAMVDIKNTYFANNVSRELGDRLLRLGSNYLLEKFSNCKLVRWGGDEFIILKKKGAITSLDAYVSANGEEQLRKDKELKEELQAEFRTQKGFYSDVNLNEVEKGEKQKHIRVKSMGFKFETSVPVSRDFYADGVYSVAHRLHVFAEMFPEMDFMRTKEDNDDTRKLITLLEASAYHSLLHRCVEEYNYPSEKTPEEITNTQRTFNVYTDVEDWARSLVKHAVPRTDGRQLRMHLVKISSPGTIKKINDGESHDMGDEFIKDFKVSEELRRFVDNLDLRKKAKEEKLPFNLLVRGTETFMAYWDFEEPVDEEPVDEKFREHLLSLTLRDMLYAENRLEADFYGNPHKWDEYYAQIKNKNKNKTRRFPFIMTTLPANNLLKEIHTIITGGQDETSVRSALISVVQPSNDWSNVMALMRNYFDVSEKYSNEEYMVALRNGVSRMRWVHNQDLSQYAEWLIPNSYYNPFDKRGKTRLEQLGIKIETHEDDSVTFRWVRTFFPKGEQSATVKYKKLQNTQQAKETAPVYYVPEENEDILTVLEMFRDRAIETIGETKEKADSQSGISRGIIQGILKHASVLKPEEVAALKRSDELWQHGGIVVRRYNAAMLGEVYPSEKDIEQLQERISKSTSLPDNSVQPEEVS